LRQFPYGAAKSITQGLPSSPTKYSARIPLREQYLSSASLSKKAHVKKQDGFMFSSKTKKAWLFSTAGYTNWE
jgi:hypothetical protein